MVALHRRGGLFLIGLRSISNADAYCCVAKLRLQWEGARTPRRIESSVHACKRAGNIMPAIFFAAHPAQ